MWLQKKIMYKMISDVPVLYVFPDKIRYLKI